MALYSSGVNPQKVDLIHKYLSQGRCLDVGCGNGLYGLPIQEACGSILQVDLLDRRVDAAREFPFREMDAQTLDLPDDSFRHAVAFDIMEHLDDDVLFISELKRVCSGTILISVPNVDDTPLQRIKLTHKHHVDKTHRREYAKDELIHKFENAGLEVLEIRPQYNESVMNFPVIFHDGGFAGRLFGRLITAQCRALCRMGIFSNPIIADWFCVIRRGHLPVIS